MFSYPSLVFITKKSITDSVLGLASLSLAESLTDLTEEGYIPRPAYSSTPSTPPHYQNPYPSPNRPNPRLEIYKPREGLKLTKMSSTMQETPIFHSTPSGRTTPVRRIASPVKLHALSSEAYLDVPLPWAALEPLSAGSPIQLPTLAQQLNVELLTSGRRKEVRKNNKAWTRKNELLCIAETFLNRKDAPGYRPLSPCAEGLFKDELYLLDKMLTPKIVKLPHKDEIGYRVDPWRYESVLIELRRIEEKRRLTVESFSVESPKVPQLPDQWPTDAIWTLPQVEVLCAAYREDVENFLAFYWDIVAKEKGTYKPSPDNQVAPFLPPVPQNPEEIEMFNIRYSAAQRVYL